MKERKREQERKKEKERERERERERSMSVMIDYYGMEIDAKHGHMDCWSVRRLVSQSVDD